MKPKQHTITEAQIRKIVSESIKSILVKPETISEGVYNLDCRPRIVQRIKKVRRDLDFLEMVVKQKEVDGNGELIDDNEGYSMTELLKNIQRDFELLFVGCGINPRHL